MRIGVLTLHNAINYGSVLQTYATQHLLEGMGHDVEIIDYRNAEIEKTYKYPKPHISKIFKETVASFVISYFYKRKKRAFAKFFKDYMHVSPKRYYARKLAISGYDVILVGSDLVWDSSFTGGLDNFYWGNFDRDEKTKLAAWSASMFVGSVTPTITKDLSNFDYISVRESSMKALLSPLTGKDVTHIIDPTLLLDKAQWSEIHVPVKERHYVLVYTYTFEWEVIETAKRLANIKGLNVIVINPMLNAKVKKGYKQCAGPAEFVSYIRDADYVIANSLHGTAFAINLEKPFYSFIKEGTSDVRRESILKQLGLENRIISENETFGDIQEIDYTKSHEILNDCRIVAKSFLTNVTGR